MSPAAAAPTRGRLGLPLAAAIETSLAHHTATDGRGLALVSINRGDEGVLTWRELGARTAALAASLESAVPPGTVVPVPAEGTLASVVQLVAALRTDLPVLPVGPGVRAEDRQAIVARLGSQGVAVAPEGIVAELERGATRWRPSARGDEPSPRRERSAGPPPASLLLASGGSSGPSRLIVDSSLRTRLRSPGLASMVGRLRWRRGHRQLVAGALDHAATLTFFLEGLAQGSQLVVARPFDPGVVLDAIESWRVEWAQFTPFQMGRLQAAARAEDLSSLAGVLHAAAPCPEPTRRWWYGRIGPDRVFEMYGTSEGIGVTLASGEEWLARPGTVGRGFLTQVKVLDDSGRDLRLGEVGEVYLRSAAGRVEHVGLRWTIDGYATVGDRGYLDADRYLYLAARRLDVINVGGEKIVPATVEAALLTHPGVVDAVVVALPDRRLGSRPYAAVELAPGMHLASADLRRYLRGKVAAAGVPRRVVVVSALPRTAAGKIRRSEVVELLARSTAATEGDLG